MADKIFISYRRDDSKQFTQLLSNELQKYYEPDQFFRDVESIHGGSNFKRSIAQALYLTRVCLVVIGDAWVKVTNSQGELRIHDENDFVHLEVATALADKEVAVIPVLINDTKMPREDQLPPALKELSSYQGVRISDDRMATDIQYLLKDLSKYLQPARPYTGYNTGGGGQNKTDTGGMYGNSGGFNRQQDTRPQDQIGPKPAKPDNYLIWAILSTILCCLVTGIISIINAAKVDSLYTEGKYAEAEAASRAAKQWAIYGIFAGIIVFVLAFLSGFLSELGSYSY